MQEVQLQSEAPVLTFALRGEIHSKNAEAFYNEVMDAYEKGKAPVRFDCSALEFLDSTTLGTFVKILKQVKNDGYTLTLAHLQPRLKKLFVICALDSVMEIEE